MSSPISDLPAIDAAAAVATARGDSQRASVFVAPATPAAPVDAATPQATTPAANAQALTQAVDQLNQHFSERRTDLKFTIDPQLHEVVVSVVDAQDGTVLRQIPSEVVLRIARFLAEQHSGLIEARA